MSNKMKTLLTLCLLTVCGCSIMKAKGYRVNSADPNIIEYYEASYETLFIDWERHGFTGQIEGFGSVGSDRSRVESEGGEIVEDGTGIFDPLRKVMP